MSNWRAEETLPDYLVRKEVVAIADIDTRRLTRILREKGAQRGCIIAGEIFDDSISEANKHIETFAGLKGADLAKVVSTKSQYDWNQGTWDLDPAINKTKVLAKADADFKVVAYDFGVKKNILRMMVDRGCDVTVVPAQTPAEEVLAMNQMACSYQMARVIQSPVIMRLMQLKPS